jgi:DNA modification methylase
LSIQENIITCGDSFELLREVADASVDLIVCDGPYGVTQNGWDKITCIQEYNLKLIRQFSVKLKEGGTLYLFGKQDCIDFIDYRPYLNLKTKIVWYQPSRLAQGRFSFTNNYDIICHFVKGARANRFNLDDIRVAQLVELEHRLRCERVPSVLSGQYGKTKFNDKGKNPGDVWGDIKQLTYKSKELVNRDALNTIQKPKKLMERLILASSSAGDLVLDPFAGVGTCPYICKKYDRRFIAFEMNPEYVAIGASRLQEQECEQDQQQEKGQGSLWLANV